MLETLVYVHKISQNNNEKVRWRWTYMCDINVNIHIANFNFTKADTFATEPVAMVYLVNVSV